MSGTVMVTQRLGRRVVHLEGPVQGVIVRAWRGGRWYEFPLLEHIRRLKLRGLAVDAGANVGNHTLWLALACGLRVAAFEPLHHELLVANVRRNGLGKRVHVYRVALGAGFDTATHVGKGALRVEGAGGELAAGRVPVQPLDSFALTGVVLIKADVEFMEPDVLRGGEQTIRRDRPVIYAEVHPGHEAALAQVLTPWRYRCTKRFHSKWNATPVEQWRYVAV